MLLFSDQKVSLFFFCIHEKFALFRTMKAYVCKLTEAYVFKINPHARVCLFF